MLFNLPLSRNLGLVLNATHPFSLWVGGVDIISRVDVTSIAITEAGAGGVSTLSFSLDDPTSTFSIDDGSTVRMHDTARDLPMFLGFLESVTYELWAAVGRTITLTAYGVEALLDSTVVPSLTTTPSSLSLSGVAPVFELPFLQLVGAYTGLRAGSTDTGNASTLTRPVGTSGVGDGLGQAVVFDGMSVRNAFEAFLANTSTTDTRNPVYLGVDMWGGIRYFSFGGGNQPWATGVIPSDYAALTIDNSTPSALHSASLSWRRDTSPGAITSAVYVTGAAPESTGWVVGDTTTGRHQSATSTSSTTSSGKQAAAVGVIGQRQGVAGRGRLTLENYTPTNVHPGSLLYITDTRMGWSAEVFLITQIDKILHAGDTQDWTVSFFSSSETPSAGPANAMRLLGTRTRSTPV